MFFRFLQLFRQLCLLKNSVFPDFFVKMEKDLEALQLQGLSIWWTLTDLNRIISYFFKASTSSEIIVFSRIVKDVQLIKKSRCSSDNSTIFSSEKNSKNDDVLCYYTKKSTLTALILYDK